MIELFAGIAGGLGLFIVGMRLLTENLKVPATRRFRQILFRWITNCFSALACGALVGVINQNLSAMIMIELRLISHGQDILASPVGPAAGLHAYHAQFQAGQVYLQLHRPHLPVDADAA